jgi:hypothetical protein
MNDRDNSPVTAVGIAGVAAVAYVLCDVLHELAHAAATLLPLGVKALSISTIGLTTSQSSPAVASAGPILNLVLAAALVLSWASAIPPIWRYFGWLFGTINLFNAAAYLVYSAVLGSGDLAVVFNATTWHWRPWIGTSGIVAYSAAVLLSRSGLRRLIGTGVLDTATASRCCSISYWWGAAVVTAGAVFNPVSYLLILTSGAAVGFGAMVGLLVLPPSLPSTAEGETPMVSLRIDWSWGVAGAISAALFIGVLGPGIRLAK